MSDGLEKIARANCQGCGGTGLVRYIMWAKPSGEKLVEGQWSCPDCAEDVSWSRADAEGEVAPGL